MIKSSDMSYKLKEEVTELLKEGLEKSKNDMPLASEIVIKSLEKKYGGAWMCVIGVKFVANIMHEPGFFIRMSNEDSHIVVYKLKTYQMKSTDKFAKKEQKITFQTM